MKDQKSLKDMSYEELEKVNQDLMTQRSELKGLQLVVTREMDKKVMTVRMKAKAATLSDPEKAAMSQVLKPKSIDSDEAFGQVGSR